MKELISKMQSLANNNQHFALVTVTRTMGSTPRKVGAKMLVNATGRVLWGTIGGGAIEKQILETIPLIIKEGEARILTYSLNSAESSQSEIVETGMICGGEMDVLIDPFGTQDSLIIIGAGHIAQALVPIAKQLNFRTIVVDDRNDFASRERFPEADEILHGPFPQILENIPFSDRAYIIIITYSHKLDEKALRGCLSKPWHYMGMIASKRKAKEILGRLYNEGIPEEILNRIHSPIGLSKDVLPVETPEEIAISIAAGLIQERKRKKS